MSKERVASWSMAGTVLAISNVKNKNAGPVGKVDLEECFPGFASLPEYERFLLAYGTKQWISDDSSGISGIAKLEAIVKDLTPENIKTASFARAKGSGISYKSQMEAAQKEAEEAKAVASLLVRSFIKLPEKLRKQTWNTYDEETQALYVKAAQGLNIDLGV